MRIAQLANFVGPSSGGMKTALDALGKGYVRAGVQRLLVVPGPADATLSTDAGDIVQFRGLRVGGGYRLIVEPWRVTDVLRRFAPTSVEISDKLTLTPVARWARREGVRSVLFSHERLDDMWATYSGLGSGAKAAVRVLNRRLVRSFDTIVTTSQYAQREFQHLADAFGCQLHRVPLGVDLDAFHPRFAVDNPTTSHTANPPAHDRRLRLVHAGRLSREKSPELAVAVAVELHQRGTNVQLDIYGEGPERERLIRAAGSAPVFLHGHVKGREELSRHMASADVALSVCPDETFGLALLESLASGTPVVTASRGGARELVDASCGAWRKPDPRELADAVLEIAARPEIDRRKAARRRAELYPWSATVARMLEVHAGSTLHEVLPASTQNTHRKPRYKFGHDAI